METKRNLGIWMDHSTADLIDTNSKENCCMIDSEFTKEVEEDAIHKNENLMHNKRQQMQEAYYKKIGAEILKYDNVLLFGPTNAKVELHNYLNKDLHFKAVKIDVVPADKMSDNEKKAFIENHFESHKK